MSKILITVLSHEIDIMNSLHLINSLKQESNSNDISILTYTDLLPHFSIHKNITEVYSLDRNFISGISQSDLYSDSFALNSFFKSIEPCYEEKWDKVINFSNDNVSSYLCSMFQATEKIGTTISKLGSPNTSNIWSNYLNFVTPKMQRDIIPTNIVRHFMSSSPYYREGNKVKFNNEFTQVATTNFSRIRQSLPTLNKTYIVGISLEIGFNGESICETSLVELLEAIESSENYKAVLIFSGETSSKNFITSLNERFDNKLISINADKSAFPSVALNLDFLISKPNQHLMIADAIDTKIIEIRDFKQDTLRSSIINPDNYILYQKEGSFADEVIILLNQEAETELPISSMTSNHKVYMSAEDDYGLLLTQIRGEMILEDEIRYHIERSYHFQLMGFPANKDFINHMKSSIDKDQLEKFVTQSKDELTDTVKLLLATLRSLKGAKQSQSNLKNFVMYLDQIMRKSTTKSITRGAIGIFEGRIESINSEDSSENMKLIEQHLFSLKRDLQSLANLFSELLSESKTNTVSQSIS